VVCPTVVWGDRGLHSGSGAAFRQEAELLWHSESIFLGVLVRFSKKLGFPKETLIARGCSGAGVAVGMQVWGYAGTGSNKIIVKVWMLHPCLSLHSS